MSSLLRELEQGLQRATEMWQSGSAQGMSEGRSRHSSMSAKYSDCPVPTRRAHSLYLKEPVQLRGDFHFQDMCIGVCSSGGGGAGFGTFCR